MTYIKYDEVNAEPIQDGYKITLELKGPIEWITKWKAEDYTECFKCIYKIMNPQLNQNILSFEFITTQSKDEAEEEIRNFPLWDTVYETVDYDGSGTCWVRNGN